ncbi:uncharacterized protein LOC9651772 [Selaginella moellendorffii]|uniref:uncharacterized protein LOC9651772 n=1 Tax=Selaginella moellendorffii TaxID=88036 RepID=UPI000D1C347C|nr:uncharacterized protein LOC9651772 [Selaginella moellendorffii]XP_024521672.1 uncharacterized protein LOC9651772 [Selaginella moellendorffii]|eukprot:XP_024521670.1 uncharacterized protein LOC9651772 [Selaginella moellendorffii]
MGMRAWISYRYKGVYYLLYKQWGQLEYVGERLVALLADHPDPEEWRRLLDKAVFIQCGGKERSEHQPSDAIIDAVRDYTLGGDDRRKREYLEDMGRMQYHSIRSVGDAVIATMAAILDDPVQFRAFIRNEAEKKLGGGNGWAFLCRNIESHERLWFRLLELGVFVSNREPVMEQPELDLMMEYVYIIDLDAGTFSVSSCHVLNSGTWKMGEIPKNWLRRLQIPEPWIELAIAYSPAVKRIVLERLNCGENWLFRMVVDKLSAPYQSFDECLNILQLIQNFLFVEDDDHGETAYAKIRKSQVHLPWEEEAPQDDEEDEEDDEDDEEDEEGRCRIRDDGQFVLRTVLAVLSMCQVRELFS